MVQLSKKTGLISGLDLGSDFVRLAIGQLVFNSNNYPDLQIIGSIQVRSEGIQKGVITSIEDTISSISASLEKAEKIIGAPIDSVYVGISNSNINTQQSRGTVAVARGDGEITEEDVDRVIEAAGTVAVPLNYGILHVLPHSFIVDDQTGIKNPVGMTGKKLEVDTKIVSVANSHIANLTKAIYRTSLDIDDFVLSVLAVGEAVTTKQERDLGVVVVDIGATSTNLIVFEEGEVIHTALIPIGSKHITNDLALVLKTTVNTAEQIKLKYGVCVSKGINRRTSINLSEFDQINDDKVLLYLVAQIIEARVTEILEKINEELIKIEKNALLPAGIVFVGGGSYLEGLVELAKQKLQLPARIGQIRGVNALANNVDDLGFVTAVSLVKWGAKTRQLEQPKINLGKNIRKISDKLKGLFKNFVP